jgi:hypothetical protein
MKRLGVLQGFDRDPLQIGARITGPIFTRWPQAWATGLGAQSAGAELCPEAIEPSARTA